MLRALGRAASRSNARGDRLSPLHLDDARERSEDDLPREIEDRPELGVEDAECAGVLPETVDDSSVCHERR